ncbi:hypothetical protein QJQ45_018050, partial [Haematococcus lacustris]
ACYAGHPRHWPRNSLFGTVFDPLNVILPPLGSTSHSGVASRRGGLVAGGISVPSSLCCRWTGQLANTSQDAIQKIPVPSPAQPSPA